ncbi:MAG: hypothetical protein IPN09_13485 [Bacteroidetes bacterium]|nr:hypothetical protein [Bacteroidota bacterium]
MEEYFGDKLLVLDGGDCQNGVESTIIDLKEMNLLYIGLEQLLGRQ